ncbi:Oxysterol-binding protein-related protein 11 [Amphibalanus amphitrite]|uniref:Oxysterol-binding protein n=2 Tax=Amphibalanus amphitrite TaxID=1232801 RepID=A0A6A4VV40_AMPAM|nr:Oxysterol-binding protein-related protein 11 [Amphibalanus amphitrite]
MCRLLEWYVPALGAGCPRAGKPYNPVLGEVFACSWPASEGRAELRFLAEQVCHHPPVSALCVSCREPEMSLQATVGCRAQYVNSVSVSLTGEATLFLPAVGETYTLNYPALYARSLLSDGWVELGGQVKISCQQTGYTASATFHTKPLSDEGEAHRVTGEVRAPDGQLVMRLTGHWDKQIQLLGQLQGDEPCTVQCAGGGARRWLRPPAAQAPHESRRVWAAVTAALRDGQTDTADAEKHAVEEAQRQRAGQGHTPRHFYQHEQSWVFREPTA